MSLAHEEEVRMVGREQEGGTLHHLSTALMSFPKHHNWSPMTLEAVKNGLMKIHTRAHTLALWGDVVASMIH